jgi:phosphoribosylanthranilate isomerase
MKLKICGMKYQENILEVAELQPDYLGFIFYEKSPRYFDGVIPKLQDNININYMQYSSTETNLLSIAKH